MSEERSKRIGQRAYEIWEREGRPTGRDMEHWYHAEAEIAREEAEQAKKEAEQALNVAAEALEKAAKRRAAARSRTGAKKQAVKPKAPSDPSENSDANADPKKKAKTAASKKK